MGATGGLVASFASAFTAVRYFIACGPRRALERAAGLPLLSA
jgi:hypothetical protein